MIQMTPAADPASTGRTATAEREAAMRAKAVDLEASFLSVMLGYAGFGAMEGSFGGGIGEEQFSSFMRDSYAKEMAAQGGIGLSETIFRAMMKGTSDG